MPADADGVTGSIAPAAALRSLATDFWVSRALHVAVKIGLADLLAKGPKSVDSLAAQSGASVDALFRLMRVLVAHNIFVEQDDKQFRLTDWGEMLRSDKPGSMRDYVLRAGEPAAWRACENLEYSIMTGSVVVRVPRCQSAYRPYF